MKEEPTDEQIRDAVDELLGHNRVYVNAMRKILIEDDEGSALTSDTILESIWYMGNYEIKELMSLDFKTYDEDYVEPTAKALVKYRLNEQ